MRKILIGAIVVLSVILAAAVALLIYLEVTWENERPSPSESTASVETSGDSFDPESTDGNLTETHPPETTEAAHATGSGGELIIGPDDDQSGESRPPEQTSATEYTPPEGRDENETPILRNIFSGAFL